MKFQQFKDHQAGLPPEVLRSRDEQVLPLDDAHDQRGMLVLLARGFCPECGYMVDLDEALSSPKAGWYFCSHNKEHMYEVEYGTGTVTTLGGF